MSALNLPEPYARLDRLIDAGDFPTARAELDVLATPTSPSVVKVLRIKLDMELGELHPGLAMQQLLALMRVEDDIPGAQQLYLEASKAAYQSRSSSMAHSHLPPPVRTPNDPGDTE